MEGLDVQRRVGNKYKHRRHKKLNYCGDKTYYFCGGKDQLSQDNYDACIASNAENKCIADRESARLAGHTGKYGPIEGPGECGDVKWMCSGVMITEEAYKETTCGKAPSCVTYQERQTTAAGAKNGTHTKLQEFCPESL